MLILHICDEMIIAKCSTDNCHDVQDCSDEINEMEKRDMNLNKAVLATISKRSRIAFV